jgi:hypothetical protein
VNGDIENAIAAARQAIAASSDRNRAMYEERLERLQKELEAKNE